MLLDTAKPVVASGEPRTVRGKGAPGPSSLGRSDLARAECRERTSLDEFLSSFSVSPSTELVFPNHPACSPRRKGHASPCGPHVRTRERTHAPTKPRKRVCRGPEGPSDARLPTYAISRTFGVSQSLRIALVAPQRYRACCWLAFAGALPVLRHATAALAPTRHGARQNSLSPSAGPRCPRPARPACRGPARRWRAGPGPSGTARAGFPRAPAPRPRRGRLRLCAQLVRLSDSSHRPTRPRACVTRCGIVVVY